MWISKPPKVLWYRCMERPALLWHPERDSCCLTTFLTCGNKYPGFTLLEVMVAVSIIAIAVTAVLSSQSQSVHMANEAKFFTSAAILAQSKIAEIEIKEKDDFASESGIFQDDFSDYRWDLTISDVIFPAAEDISDHLRQIDLMVSRGEDKSYQYRVRFYRFFPKIE